MHGICKSPRRVVVEASSPHRRRHVAASSSSSSSSPSHRRPSRALSHRHPSRARAFEPILATLPSFRRDAVAPSESVAVVAPSVVVIAVVRAPRDAPPRRRRIVASSPSSPSSFSLFWLPTTAFRGRHQHYPSLVCRSAPLSSPAVVAVVAAAITTACSRPIRPPSSSSRRHRGHLTSWFGSCRCPQFQPCSPASVVVGSSLVGIGPRRHRRRGQSPRCRKPLPQLLPQQPDASPQQQQPCSMQPQQHQPAAPPNSAEPSSNSSGTNSSVPAAAAVAAQQPAISKAVPTTWTWFLFFVKIFCIAA